MRYIFLFIFLQTYLFACATCALMSPTAEVELNLEISNKKLNKIHTTWIFIDSYTESLLVQYDKNRNYELDPNELDLIKQAKINYLVPKGMVTTIGFTKDINQEDNEIVLEPQYENFSIHIENDKLFFSYDATLNLTLQNDSSLSFTFEDDEGWFSFIVNKLEIQSKEFTYKKNLYLFTSSVLFVDPVTVEKKYENSSQEEKKSLQIEKMYKKEKEIQEKNENKFFGENILRESVAKIKELFETIKDEKHPLSYFSLLLFAYIYGVIHALGPGHGKTLVASYFLTNERSYSKAFWISASIGIVHTFSAFLLTLSIYYLVDTLLSQFVQDSVYFTTKISALMIMSIAIYLFYTKIKAYKKIKTVSISNFSTSQHISTCACSACKTEKTTDIGLILSAGIIPCPGTTTIFIFSISLGLYYAGFLAAIVMSLGMSTIIYLSAILSVTLRNKTLQNNSNVKKYLEFGSLGLKFILGIFLFVA